ncbi:MAG: hypothetical protein ACLP0J_28555 [Solirubrobacteraceae bacterium]
MGVAELANRRAPAGGLPGIRFGRPVSYRAPDASKPVTSVDQRGRSGARAKEHDAASGTEGSQHVGGWAEAVRSADAPEQIAAPKLRMRLEELCSGGR